VGVLARGNAGQTNAAAIGALTHYAAGGGTYPLATTHAKVLAVPGAVRQDVQSAAGRQVQTDFLVRPVFTPASPAPVDGVQLGLCFERRRRAHPAPRSRERFQRVAYAGRAVPALARGDWVRVTSCRTTRTTCSRVAFDGGAAVADPDGWSGFGGSQPGPWFAMVRTNGMMTSFYLSGVTPDGAGGAFWMT